MRYYFQKSFIATVADLLKKNSYRDCEKAIIEHVFKVSKETLFERCAGYRLNPSAKNPIVKLRIAYNQGKSGGYRLYFFIIKKGEKLYFGHLYPKFGKKGKPALSVKKEKQVIKSLLKDVKTESLEEVFWDKTQNKICYLTNKEPLW